jgi:hypothetical protein
LKPGKLIKTSFTPETLLVFEPNLLAPGTSSWEEEPQQGGANYSQALL